MNQYEEKLPTQEQVVRTLKSNQVKHKVILSIDGGGMRGVIPGRFIQKLEELTGSRLYDLVDMIAGTSTGGILAGLLCVPEKEFKGQDLIDFYYQDGPKIFSNPFWRILNIGGIVSSKYRSENLYKHLSQYIGDVKMVDIRKPLLITSYDKIAEEPVFFKSYEDYWNSFRLLDAAVSTASAPTYFPSHDLTFNNKKVSYIDAGGYINNPTVSALVDGYKMWNYTQNIFCINISTGSYLSKDDKSSYPNGGLAGWGIKVFNYCSDGSQDTAAYQAKILLEGNYFRFNPNLKKVPALDDATKKTLDYLIDCTDREINHHYESIKSLGEFLVKNSKIV